MFKVTKVGDWNKFGAYMGTVQTRIHKGMNNAEGRAGMVVVAAIKKGIAKQAPGGKRFRVLHPFTIAEKKSTKALVDKGTLLNSITWKRVAPFVVFVGVLRKAKNKDGRPLVNIASILEEGFTIAVTPKMRVYLASKGFPLKVTTKELHIPARPFISPVFKDSKVKIAVMLEMQAAMSEALML